MMQLTTNSEQDFFDDIRQEQAAEDAAWEKIHKQKQLAWEALRKEVALALGITTI